MERVFKFKKNLYNNKLEYKDFIIKMINTMEAIGNYVGIDTNDFENNFFITSNSTFKEDRGEFCYYCCNNINNILNVIYYRADSNSDIPLKKASTFQVNLKNGEFIYHCFRNTTNQWDVNIIHQKMNGILPYYIFDTSNPYNLTGIIDADFSTTRFSQNTIFEMETVIEESRNEKQYIDDDSFIWEILPSLSDLNEDLKYYCGDAYNEIKNLTVEDAKEVVISRKNYFKSISSIMYTLELINLKNKQEKFRTEKVNALTKVIRMKKR